MDSERRARLLLAAVVAYNVAFLAASADLLGPFWEGDGHGASAGAAPTCPGRAGRGLFGSGYVADPFCLGGPTRTILSEGFESGSPCLPSRWQHYEYNSGQSCVVRAPTHTGRGAMLVSDYSRSLSAGAASACVPVSPGQAITAMAWYRGDSPPDPNAHFNLYLEFFGTPLPSGSGARIGVVWDQVRADGTAWHPFAVSGTAPAGAVCAWVLLYSSMGASGAYYVDDVSLWVSDGATG